MGYRRINSDFALRFTWLRSGTDGIGSHKCRSGDAGGESDDKFYENDDLENFAPAWVDGWQLRARECAGTAVDGGSAVEGDWKVL